jgi:hypothetical protein
LAATNVGQSAVTNNAAQATDLRFFIVLLLVVQKSGYLVGLEVRR